MFRNLAKLKIDRSGSLVDDRGIIHARAALVKTANIKFHGIPYVFETPVDAREYSKLEKELESLSPKPNAWRDAAILERGIETLELPDMGLDGRIHLEEKEVSYKVHRLEFYHLGD